MHQTSSDLHLYPRSSSMHIMHCYYFLLDMDYMVCINHPLTLPTNSNTVEIMSSALISKPTVGNGKTVKYRYIFTHITQCLDSLVFETFLLVFIWWL